MDSGSESQLLSAFMDDSLEPSQRRAVAARIAQDERLQRDLQAMRRLRTAVRANAERHTAPAVLKARLRVLGDWRATPVARHPGFDWRRVLGWGDRIAWRPLGMALSVGAVVVSALHFALWQPGVEERLMQAAVTSHLQATSGRLVDVSSSDRNTVQPWFAERLAFSAPVRVPATAEATLVGGRLDSLEGRSVAAVVYSLRDHIVHEFIWPADDDSAYIASASLRGLNVSHWSRGGLRYCVVSDLPRGQLVAFAESLAQADNPR